MARGNLSSANLLRHNKQLIKLQVIVAEAARDGRTPRQILFNERPHDIALKSLLVIDHVVRNAKRFGHAPCIVNVVNRAAPPLHGFRHAFVPGEAPLVPELHGQANNVASFGAQHGCNGRGVNPSRHGHGDGFGIQHLAISSNPTQVYLASLRDTTSAPSHTGDSSRRRATVSGITSSAKSTSSGLFCFPRLKRMLAFARSERIPMAISTCDGSIAPEEHAAPVETASPFKSSAMTRASPSMPSK